MNRDFLQKFRVWNEPNSLEARALLAPEDPRAPEFSFSETSNNNLDAHACWLGS
jgi:hypothetical protein